MASRRIIIFIVSFFICTIWEHVAKEKGSNRFRPTTLLNQLYQNILIPFYQWAAVWAVWMSSWLHYMIFELLYVQFKKYIETCIEVAVAILFVLLSWMNFIIDYAMEASRYNSWILIPIGTALTIGIVACLVWTSAWRLQKRFPRYWSFVNNIVLSVNDSINWFKYGTPVVSKSSGIHDK